MEIYEIKKLEKEANLKLDRSQFGYLIRCKNPVRAGQYIQYIKDMNELWKSVKDYMEQKKVEDL